MEVNAKQTEVRIVKVELSGGEQARVAQAQTSDLLIGILSNRLEQKLVANMTSDLKKGAYCIREAYFKGERQWCLVELDADWDYHNNVGRDETLRPLSEAERAKYFQLDNSIAEVQQLISELGV